LYKQVVENKVQKWGNSLGLCIPSALAAELGIESGTTVSISVENKCLTVKVKATKKSAYRLAEMLKQISKKNLHDAIETGSPLGKEAW
jgi:antitoxin MazE